MTEASPARIVADADVLAADLLCGAATENAARAALDHVRRHSWVTLVASDQLLDDAQAVVTSLAEASLAADWRERIEHERTAVDHPDGDQPALASAYRGGAAHLLTYDEGLRSAKAGVSLQDHMRVSVRPPDAFARLFDPESLYEVVEGGTYPGPDRDPRA